MNYQLYREEDFNTSEWSGGTTKELAIFPENAAYSSRDFIWRLSSAVVEHDESDFTRLPDYDRVLMVLEGDVVLAYRGERVARLQQLEQDRFDGGFLTKSYGRIRGYNLMVRKGCQGFLDTLDLTETFTEPEREDPEQYAHICQTFYCREGYAVVSLDGQTCMVKEGQQLVVQYDSLESVPVGVMGEGILIRAQIFYDDMVLAEQEIPEEKGTFEDFKECMKLSLTNFRGSRFIFRYLEALWYDESLQKGIRKIERFYLPMLLWFAGIAVFGIFGGVHWPPLVVLCVLIGWSLLALFVISPLLYFQTVPKPVKAHIKHVDALNDYEKVLWQREKDANPVADRILKKYKFTVKDETLPDKGKK